MKRKHKQVYISCGLGFFIIVIFVCIMLFTQKKTNIIIGAGFGVQDKEMERQKNDTVEIVKNQKESVVIKSDERFLYGEERWKSFLNNAGQKKQSHITIYLTEDEINILTYMDLSYNGECYIISKKEREEERQYKYMYCFGFEGEKSYKMYVLMNEEGMTLDKFIRGMADSINIPDSSILFTIEK